MVSLAGEHDLSTDGALSMALARAIASDSSDIVVDLSEVSFIGASTLGVIARAREFVRRPGRALVVRHPSAVALRVIGICGLEDLLEPASPDRTALAATGTRLWAMAMAAGTAPANGAVNGPARADQSRAGQSFSVELAQSA
jgi:anti-anti-sigma factor